MVSATFIWAYIAHSFDLSAAFLPLTPEQLPYPPMHAEVPYSTTLLAANYVLTIDSDTDGAGSTDETTASARAGGCGLGTASSVARRSTTGRNRSYFTLIPQSQSLALNQLIPHR